MNTYEIRAKQKLTDCPIALSLPAEEAVGGRKVRLRMCVCVFVIVSE